MLKTFKHLFGFLLLLTIIPLQGRGQTTADDKADKVERAHRKAVVRHTVRKTRTGVKKGYHKVAHAVMSPIDKAKARHAADEKSEGEPK
jgi:hypothetical protein